VVEREEEKSRGSERKSEFFSSSFSGGKKGLSLIETKIRQLTPAFGLYS